MALGSSPSQRAQVEGPESSPSRRRGRAARSPLVWDFSFGLAVLNHGQAPRCRWLQSSQVSQPRRLGTDSRSVISQVITGIAGGDLTEMLGQLLFRERQIVRMDQAIGGNLIHLILRLLVPTGQGPTGEPLTTSSDLRRRSIFLAQA